MITQADIDGFYEEVERMGLKFPVAEISRATGEPKANVSRYLSKKLNPSESFLKKFYISFPKSYKNVPQETRLNEDETYLKSRQGVKLADRKKKIPFYDAPASAGLTETEMTAIHAPAGTIDVGDLLHDSQAAIRIYGNSMLPNYPPGCVVGLAKVNDSFIEPGEVYVIETSDRRLLKRLFYKNDETDSETITCYSDNTMKFEGGSRHGKLAYPPFDLPKKDIKRMYVVTGVIKRNANSIIINR